MNKEQEILVNRILELSKELETVFPYTKDPIIQETIDYLSDLGEIIFFHRGMKGVEELNNLIHRLK